MKELGAEYIQNKVQGKMYESLMDVDFYGQTFLNDPRGDSSIHMVPQKARITVNAAKLKERSGHRGNLLNFTKSVSKYFSENHFTLGDGSGAELSGEAKSSFKGNKLVINVVFDEKTLKAMCY